MQSWFNTLSARERLMVMVAGVAAILFALYQFVIVPIGAWQAASTSQLSRQKLGYEQVMLAARLHGGQSVVVQSGTFDRATPLNRALEVSASQVRLVILTTDGNSDEGVQLTLAPADPEIIYGWIDTVKQQYGAIVVEARFSRARNNPALIKTDRLVFARPAPANASARAGQSGPAGQ